MSNKQNKEDNSSCQSSEDERKLKTWKVQLGPST